MQNINELFDTRDMIIESMGYFNPLILEENTVVLSEGFVGGLVERIQALWKMIKGWIQKLIDWVAGKFKLGKKNKNAVSSDSSKDVQNLKKNIEEVAKDVEKEKTEVKKEVQKIIKEVEEDTKKIENSDTTNNDKEKEEIKQKITYYKDRMEKFKKKIGALPKRIKEQENIVAKYKNRTIENNITKYKLPDLKNAKVAVNDILEDCRKAISKDNPYDDFRGKKIKDYFLKSNNELEVLKTELSKYKDLMSYTYNAGEDCVDQLRKYEKSLESTYRLLEKRAGQITDKEDSDNLLKRAKGINQISQQVLKGTVTLLYSYVNKLSVLRATTSNDIIYTRSELHSAEVRLEELKTEYMDLYKDNYNEAARKIKELQAKLK